MDHINVLSLKHFWVLWFHSPYPVQGATIAVSDSTQHLGSFPELREAVF